MAVKKVEVVVELFGGMIYSLTRQIITNPSFNMSRERLKWVELFPFIRTNLTNNQGF